MLTALLSSRLFLGFLVPRQFWAEGLSGGIRLSCRFFSARMFEEGQEQRQRRASGLPREDSPDAGGTSEGTHVVTVATVATVRSWANAFAPNDWAHRNAQTKRFPKLGAFPRTKFNPAG